MHLLRGAVWTYAWCADRALPNSPDDPSPTAHPEAELRLGRTPWRSHTLVTGEGEQPLLDTLLDDPDGRPGATARGRFDDTAPFLMMVLAADEPLSLQAHPSAAQAVGGFAREERSGIPVRLVPNWRSITSAQGARQSPPKPGRCSSWASATPAMPVCRQPCC